MLPIWTSAHFRRFIYIIILIAHHSNEAPYEFSAFFLASRIVQSSNERRSIPLLLLVCAVNLAIYMVGTVGMTASLTDSTFMLSVAGTLLTALSTYVFCFFSENVTNDLHSIGDAFYQSNWYAHPAKQQQLYNLYAIDSARSTRVSNEWPWPSRLLAASVCGISVRWLLRIFSEHFVCMK